MLEQPRAPDWISAFSYPGWTNVFQLLPTNDHLYPLALRAEWKSQFNDWNGPILLLDGKWMESLCKEYKVAGASGESGDECQLN